MTIYFDLADENLFGNEVDEDEDQALLNEHFVDHEIFSPFFERNKLLSVVSARKGMGKSAF